ncbi:MAG: STAS domain-containing protein [Bacteroidetes bacterium]|nr:STAS domain-containing protein [Bacteroidota bacterium]
MINEFKLQSELKNNCLVIDTFGYINNVGGQKIVDEFKEHSQNGINNIVLNLKETKIVNSIGISFIIEIIESLNDSEGKLIFANLDPTIEKTFTIMGLFQYANKADNVDEALKLI